MLDATATPRVAFNGTGTANDQQVVWFNSKTGVGVVSGPAQELLILEFFDSAAHTTVTANFVVEFNVTVTYRDGFGNVQRRDQPLALVDRVTKSTSGTTTATNGINDNPATVANKWTPILAFKPQPNETWFVKSYQRFVSDGT